MKRRLLLVRHGRSSQPRRGWLDAEGVRRWRAGYDAAGIVADDSPPSDLVEEAQRADVIVASNLPRSLESAARLAAGKQVEVSPLVRESPLEIPRWVRVRLPLAIWDALLHARWYARILRGTDASEGERSRAAAAARWLTSLSNGRRDVVVVTHGVFRRLLAPQLILLGWHPSARPRSYRHWSAWELTR